MNKLGRGRGPLGLVLAMMALVLAPASQAQTALDGRVQLHRAPNRSVPYMPLASQGGSVGAPTLVMGPLATIELDGNPLQNVYSNLRPIDVDGDGTYEFVQYNGFRFMQVWDAQGRKLWRRGTAAGRLHHMESGTHRDTVAVLDLNGDGKQDIAHCWMIDGQRVLVYRRGFDGKILRKVPLDGSVTQQCQMAAFRMAATRQTLILVAHSLPYPASRSCKHNWVDYWARAVAFDLQQRKVWDRNTCDAGHYAYPFDEDFDGLAEGIFVGKYLLRADGTLQCVLDTWPGTDHVDGLSVADLDPIRPGLEVVAVGRTGTALFEAASCKQIWRVPLTTVRDPQHVAVAKLDPDSAQPLIVLDERGSVRRPRSMILNGQGRVVATNTSVVMPMQNANLDGALGVDEKVGSWGTVIDRLGNVRLGRWWYWNLKGTKVVETKSGPYPTNYDRWQAFPLVFDYDHDGRDEIVTWGQSLIVVGKLR